VSILFADLVGFTERSDTADPEDVRRTLVPFHERAKRSIQGFGGTADAVVAGVWAALEERWGAYGCPYEQALAAIAIGDPDAIARGRAALADLGVPD
jgi:class 3 adenylate cyclase